ncbi:MAG TPA: methyltransferase [Bryobacteraceae bacterium]|jgi:hypothetical protein|nr:methyltransferase [Bryobacteraceae bacterium]
MLLQTMEQDPAFEMKAETPTPHAVLLQLLFGKHLAYCVSAVARLGVADHMNEYSVDVQTLAQNVGAKPDALYRVMRALAGAGVFEQTSERSFRITPTGELLRSNAPQSVRYTAMQMGDPWSCRAWEHFTNTVQTGVDGVSQAYGKNVFEVLAEEPEQAEHFNRSMTGYSAVVTEPFLRAYDFNGVRRLCDVGGGHGRLLSEVLRKYPRMTGVVYDLPEVVEGAYNQEHVTGCGERIRFESGSFFERVPAGCDSYMMKFILHDWSDEHCRTILRRIREQLPPRGRVLVVEQVVTRSADLTFAKLLDIEMLALTVGGRERTEDEFADLFASAGLQLTQVFETETPLCVLEARPV